jgi:hypothetical protein
MGSRSRAGDSRFRQYLAAGIVAAGIIGLVLIGVIAIATAGKDRTEITRLVIASLTPLLGTWVGTVLAFYFARENLQAATESTLALAGIETTTPVVNVMIKDEDVIAYDLGTGETVDGVKLADLRAKMAQINPPSRRIPIRTAAGSVLYVVHDSTLTAYAESAGQTTQTLDKTLGDLLASPEFKELIEAIGFVPRNATVADARKVMASIRNCNDVFVTDTGKREERAVGWLTNTLLAGVQ